MIKAVIFDIYGTIIKSDAGDLDETLDKKKLEIEALRNLCVPAEKVLEDYVKEIKKSHSEKEKKGVKFPEVDIIKIWKETLKKNKINKDPKAFALDFYDICSQRTIYSGVKETLEWLKETQLEVGIISNAQFYTEIDLLELLDIKDIKEYFNKDLIFYSFELGCSKPNLKAFNLAKKTLEKKGIKPEEVIYVGNHSKKDIATAKKVGFKSCLFESEEVRLDERIKEDFKIKKFQEIKKIIETN